MHRYMCIRKCEAEAAWVEVCSETRAEKEREGVQEKAVEKVRTVAENVMAEV